MVNPNPYQPGPQPYSASQSKNTQAKTGFILGLCAILGWLLPIVGFPLTITGLVFSGMGLSRASTSGVGRAQAIWGLILNIAFLVLTIINAVAGAVLNLKRAGY